MCMYNILDCQFISGLPDNQIGDIWVRYRLATSSNAYVFTLGRDCWFQLWERIGSRTISLNRLRSGRRRKSQLVDRELMLPAPVAIIPSGAIHPKYVSPIIVAHRSHFCSAARRSWYALLMRINTLPRKRWFNRDKLKWSRMLSSFVRLLISQMTFFFFEPWASWMSRGLNRLAEKPSQN